MRHNMAFIIAKLAIVMKLESSKPGSCCSQDDPKRTQWFLTRAYTGLLESVCVSHRPTSQDAGKVEKLVNLAFANPQKPRFRDFYGLNKDIPQLDSTIVQTVILQKI